MAKHECITPWLIGCDEIEGGLFKEILIEILLILSKLNSTMSQELSENVTECRWEDLWVLFLSEFVVFVEVKNINIIWLFSRAFVSIASFAERGPQPASRCGLRGVMGPAAQWRRAIFTRVS